MAEGKLQYPNRFGSNVNRLPSSSFGKPSHHLMMKSLKLTLTEIDRWQLCSVIASMIGQT